MNTLIKTYIRTLFLIAISVLFLGACSGGDEPKGDSDSQADQFSDPNVDSLSDIVGVWLGELDVTRDIEEETGVPLPEPVIADYYIVIRSNGDAYQFIDLASLPGGSAYNCYVSVYADAQVIHIEDNMFSTTFSEGFIEASREGNTLYLREDLIVLEYTRSSLTLSQLRSNECT